MSGVAWAKYVRDDSRFLLVSVGGIAAGLLVWELAGRSVSQVLFAGPTAVAVRLAEASVDIELTVALWGSLQTLLLGYGLAIAVGAPLGFLMGRSARLFALADPILVAVYAIPPVALVPFFVIWLGVFFEARVALVFVMAVFEILTITLAGSRNLSHELLTVGRAFGARRMALFVKIMLPASLPFLFAALRIGLARGVAGMITAELLFVPVNLGKRLVDSAGRFDTAGLLAVIVIVAAVGLLSQEALKVIERRALPWHVRD